MKNKAAVALTTLLLTLLSTIARANAGAPLAYDSLFKGESSSSVYWYASDGKRYVFPNEGVYYSWFEDFSTVRTVHDSYLYQTPIGGNVTYRPGINMVKLTSDPKTYLVTSGSRLRPISSESTATDLFGLGWSKYVRDLSEALFINYHLDSQIIKASDVDFDRVIMSVSNPSDNIFYDEPKLPLDASVSLTVDKTSILEGETVKIISSVSGLPSTDYYTEIRDSRNLNLIKTCQYSETAYCVANIPLYKTSIDQVSMYYEATVKRGANASVIVRTTSPVISFK